MYRSFPLCGHRVPPRPCALCRAHADAPHGAAQPALGAPVREEGRCRRRDGGEAPSRRRGAAYRSEPAFPPPPARPAAGPSSAPPPAGRGGRRRSGGSARRAGGGRPRRGRREVFAAAALPPPRGLGAGRLLAAPPVPSASRPARRRRLAAMSGGGSRRRAGTSWHSTFSRFFVRSTPGEGAPARPAGANRYVGHRTGAVGRPLPSSAPAGERREPPGRGTGGPGTVPAAPVGVATPVGEGGRRSGRVQGGGGGGGLPGRPGAAAPAPVGEVP